jgi:hypothetical protein
MYIDKIYFSEGEVKCLVLQLIKGVSNQNQYIDELCS